MGFEFFSNLFKRLFGDSEPPEEYFEPLEENFEPMTEIDESSEEPQHKSRYAKMVETDSEDENLPPPVFNARGQTVELSEIPFDKTRKELIDKYLLVIKQIVLEDRLKDIPDNSLIAHYLFIQSLLGHGTEKYPSTYNALTNHIAQHLKNNAPKSWEKMSPYIEKSEYPIVEWLKTNPTTNFIRDFLYDNANELLTKNQRKFLEEYRKSPAFFFPDSIYYSWLAHSYEENSSLRPHTNGIGGTDYFHDKITDNLVMRTARKKVTFSSQHYYESEQETINSSFRFDMSQSELLRIQGRTLLFLTEHDDIVAVKVQKSGEDESTLTEEYLMAKYLQNHQKRIGLKSHLPSPLGRYSLKRSKILDQCKTSPDYETFESLISDQSDLEVYVYSAPLSYFTYLHDPKLDIEDFSQSVRRNVHDLFMLLREGIVFPQLADIFHTHSYEEERDDKGRYQALVQLLQFGMFEMGRIDKWQKAVEFLNLRESGLADLGDSISIKELLEVSEFSKKYYPSLMTGGYHRSLKAEGSNIAYSLFTNKRKIFGNYLYLNIMAEYLFVIQLAIGRYGDYKTRDMDPENKEDVWDILSELMFYCCADAVTLMTGIPENRALDLIKQRANASIHAKQTQFWMTPDYSQLDKYSIKNKQYMLYPGESGYDVRAHPTPHIGFSNDGVHQDLGGYNQGSPLKELEKLLYATVTLIEDTKQLDNKFLAQLDKTKRLLEADAGAKACYHAVAKLLDMSRPGTQFQRRLALSYYETVKEKYPGESRVDLRFEEIKKEEAVSTIQRFFRQYPKTSIPKETLDNSNTVATPHRIL